VRLERRLLLRLGAAASAFLLLLSLAGAAIFFRGFRSLEDRDARARMDVLLDRIEVERDALADLARDWSTWDDAWIFARGEGHFDFERVNLPPETFDILHLSSAFMIDAEGHPLLVSGPSALEEAEPILGLIAPGRRPDPVALRGERSGLLLSPSGILLVASSPIRRSDRSGAVAGVLLFARPLSLEGLTRGLAPEERLELRRLERLHGLLSGEPSGSGPEGSRVSPEGGGLRVERILRDVTGRPILEVRLRLGRPVAAQGLRAIGFFLAASAGGVCLFAGVLAVLLRRTLLERLKRLNAFVLRVRETRDLSLVPDVTGEDELGELARGIRRMLEALRVAREEVEAANRTREEFFAGVSHELRTPLTAILGFASLLAERMDRTILPALREGEAPEDEQGREELRQSLRQGRRHLDIILSEGNRLKILIDDVLDLARLRLGTSGLTFEPVDFLAVAAEAAELLHPAAEAKGIGLILAGDPVTAPADRRAIYQLLVNLLSNAVKFTDRGTVTCRVRSVGTGEVLLEVEDTGVGIPPERREGLFRKFYQADPTRARQGTGLGLAICQAVVAAHGGSIACDPAPSGGTVFRVRLPRREGSDGASA
jgi:signal transduction histidine kinase